MLCFSYLGAKHKFSLKTSFITKKKRKLSECFFKVEILRQVLCLKSPEFLIKSFENTALENFIFISKSWRGLLPSIFNSCFKLSFESHSYCTRWSNHVYLKIPLYHSKTFGSCSMLVNAIYVWNHLPSYHQNFIFHQLRVSKMKE